MRKAILTAIIIAALSISLVVGMQLVKANSKMITVPDDYTDIQAAIDNASAGDTVFVRKGIYNVDGYDGVLIDKPLSLIGEDSQATTIAAENYKYGRDVVRITADNVTISGFTITGERRMGINIEDTSGHLPVGCRIIGNIIRGCRVGINTYGSASFSTEAIEYTPSYLTISGNNITGNERGMYIASSNSTISGNNIMGNDGEGITVDSCRFLTITGNSILNNGLNRTTNDKGGLWLRWWGPFYVYGNNISNNRGHGIGFEDFCNNCTVWGNEIANNDIGIQEYYVKNGGKGNIVHQNNIIGNQRQVAVNERLYPTVLVYEVNVVALDNGEIGNYWSDYLTKYPYVIEVDTSGIGNTQYLIDANNIDHYPLLNPINIPLTSPSPGLTPSPSVSEFPSCIILLIMTVAMLLTIVFTKLRTGKKQ